MAIRKKNVLQVFLLMCWCCKWLEIQFQQQSMANFVEFRFLINKQQFNQQVNKSRTVTWWQEHFYRGCNPSELRSCSFLATRASKLKLFGVSNKVVVKWAREFFPSSTRQSTDKRHIGEMIHVGWIRLGALLEMSNFSAIWRLCSAKYVKAYSSDYVWMLKSWLTNHFVALR